MLLGDFMNRKKSHLEGIGASHTEIPVQHDTSIPLFYCIPAQKMSKWKQCKCILKKDVCITHIENAMYKIEVPVWKKKAHPRIRKWLEKRIEKNIMEYVKAKRGIMVVATSIKEVFPHIAPWQVQENFKLPLLYALLAFCMQAGKLETRTVDVYFLCHTFSKDTVDIIKQLASLYKSVNIVTEERVAYTKLADEVYEKSAQLITVSNHKRKALKQAKWIINYDFEIKELLSYTVHREAILLHLQTKMKEMPIGFCKLVINDIQLSQSTPYKNYLQTLGLKSQDFELEEVLGSWMHTKHTRQEKQALLEELDIPIQALIGMNGRIGLEEVS